MPSLSRAEATLRNLVARMLTATQLHRQTYLTPLSAYEPPAPLLFVCLGNICRSAYAANKFNRLLLDRPDSPIAAAISAGVRTTPGKEADPMARQMAAERGVDLTSHRTSSVTPASIAEAGLILVMEPVHRREVLKQAPGAGPKILYLGALSLGHPAGKSFDLIIRDPYGKDKKTFEACFEQIDLALEQLVDLLVPAR